MENIKSLLLKSLPAVYELADYHEEKDQELTLSSFCLDKDTETKYELFVTLIAHKSEKTEPGNYHADRGDYEGRGSYFEVSGITVLNVVILEDGSDQNKLFITNQEANEAIIF